MKYTLSLTPSDVTVGERTQLVYRFETEKPFPLKNFSLNEKDEIVIEANETGLYSIFSIQLESDGSDCVMVIDFIPWKAGELAFLPFDFSSIIISKSNLNENDKDQEETYIIQVPPFMIRSVTEETGISVLQPPSPPLVIPGTTYTIYIAVILCLLFLMLCTFVLFRFKQIRALCRNIWINTKRRHNTRKFIRLLRAFVNEKGDFKDDVFSAEKISKELRIYMERRFNLEFESAVTSEIMNIAEGFFAECCMEELSNIQKVLIRCDELRFSDDEQKKVFQKEERVESAAKLKTALLHFEKYHEIESSEKAFEENPSMQELSKSLSDESNPKEIYKSGESKKL